MPTTEDLTTPDDLTSTDHPTTTDDPSTRGTTSALTRLLDEAAVRDATARFAEAIMNEDYDAFRALWADDAEWALGGTEHQPFERRADGVDDIVSMLGALWEGNAYFTHFAVQGPIHLDGDDATARTFCHEAASGPGGRYYRTNGVWTDRLRRSGNGWVFTSRRYHYLWLDLSPFTGEVFPR